MMKAAMQNSDNPGLCGVPYNRAVRKSFARPRRHTKSTPLESAFGKLLNALTDLQRQLPRLDHGDDSLLMRDILQTLEEVSYLQTMVRSCKVKMRVDRARVEGRPIGGRPRGNNQADETAIVDAIANDDSIATVSRESGLARSTIRKILSRRGREVWSLSNDDRRALILGLQIATAHETGVLDKLELRFDHGPAELRRQELQESINARRTLIAKFGELRAKLRTADLSESSRQSPMSESSLQANLDPLPEGEGK